MNSVTRRSRAIALLVAASVTGALVLPSGASAQSLFDDAKKALSDVMKPSGSRQGDNAAVSNLPSDKVAHGLRQALDLGVEAAVSNLGEFDGFNNDPVAHIPLPENVRRAQDLLDKAGLGSYGQEIELRMNRAAEDTMQQAGDILLGAIRQMSLEDAKGILQGPDDAATSYLQRVASKDIEGRLRPVINDALAETGALSLYDQMVGQYSSLPLVPDLKASLTDHATQKAMDGLFHYLALQEADIRNDPARWTTDVLKDVFSSIQ
ncbi:DUF4197 domain-containing protein [Thalassospira sp. MA62]|nr:DUF4197 domain-containing protein [Thalassospira sp. MA62]